MANLFMITYGTQMHIYILTITFTLHPHMLTLIHTYIFKFHAHLETHIRPHPHVQDSYFHIEHEYKSYCQKKNIYIYVYCKSIWLAIGYIYI